MEKEGRNEVLGPCVCHEPRFPLLLHLLFLFLPAPVQQVDKQRIYRPLRFAFMVSSCAQPPFLQLPGSHRNECCSPPAGVGHRVMSHLAAADTLRGIHAATRQEALP